MIIYAGSVEVLKVQNIFCQAGNGKLYKKICSVSLCQK